MGNNSFDRLVEKIIAVLKNSSIITKSTGAGADARIFGSHIATIQDSIFPAVSIHLFPGTRRQVSGGAIDIVQIQIDPWFDATGKNAQTWDDVMECHSAIVSSLHRTGLWDDTIGIKVVSMTMTARGPQIQDPHGIMHYPSRWEARVTV